MFFAANVTTIVTTGDALPVARTSAPRCTVPAYTNKRGTRLAAVLPPLRYKGEEPLQYKGGDPLQYDGEEQPASRIELLY